MQNVGTWNSDLSLLFFFMLISPIALYFLGGCFERYRTRIVKEVVYKQSPPKTRTIYRQSPPKVVYKKSPPKIVYRDRPKKKKKKKSVVPRVVDSMQQDGIDALVSMGTKKMQAKKVIQSLCAKKHYNSLDSLLRDAFSA